MPASQSKSWEKKERGGKEKGETRSCSLATAVVYASSEEVLERGAVTTFSADGLAEEALEVVDVLDRVGHGGQPVLVVVVRLLRLVLLCRPLAVLGGTNGLLQLAKVLGGAVDGAGAVVLVVEDNLVQDGAAVGEQGNVGQDGLVVLVVVAAVVTGVAAVAVAAVHVEAQGANPDGDGQRAGRVVRVVALARVELRLAGGDEEGSGVHDDCFVSRMGLLVVRVCMCVLGYFQ